MSDIYSTLQVSPRKRHPSDSEDASTSTPKKLRTALLTPSSASRHGTISGTPSDSKKLPDHLLRLCTIYKSLQHAISHALATCAVSPTSDSGHLRNVVNHLSLKTYSGLSSSFEVDDLKRLCWLWEWDGKNVPRPKEAAREEDNPFLDEISSTPTDWTRGAMGFLVSATTHFSRQARQRVPAYGIGIEIEVDFDKDMGSGMAAVARWTSAADVRQREFRKKAGKWAELHADGETVPAIPLADLPRLEMPVKASSLTMKLASASPKGASSKSLLLPLTSSIHSPLKSPSKKAGHQFAVPFPALSLSTSPTKSSILLPQTPRHKRRDTSTLPITPQTPSNSSALSDAEAPPITPSKQIGASAETAPATPSTSRRQALYERVRQRSLSSSPTKNPKGSDTSTAKFSRDQMLKMSQDEMRRRCLLGRLSGIAESVWMLFSAPTTGSATPGRKRRVLPASEITTAIIKSSPVPLSTAEANESLALLMKLCPFFLRKLDIQGEEWLEMPASINNSGTSGTSSVDNTPTKRGLVPPASPGSKVDSAELIHRSPKRVKKEAGGLREVREIIRRELDLQD